MNKKLRYLIIFCVLIIALLLVFTACDKGSDNGVENFYGEYSIPLDKFYEVEFWRSTEAGYDDRYTYNIVGVKKNSFVRAVGDSFGYEYTEMTFDENLLAEVDRLIAYMGDHAVFDKDGVYFVDSRERLNIPCNDFTYVGGDSFSRMWASNSFKCCVHYDEENINSIKYKKTIKVLSVGLESKGIKDKNDIAWEIKISRKYKKYMEAGQ